MKPDTMPTALRLAAIISLLSSSALHGATAGKSEALRLHLEAAAFAAEPLDPQLRTVLEDALAEWLSIECHQNSVSVDQGALAPCSRALH
jgi:hypothetical protein